MSNDERGGEGNMHIIIEFTEGNPVSLYHSQIDIEGDFFEMLQAWKVNNEAIVFEDENGNETERNLGDMVSFKIIL